MNSHKLILNAFLIVLIGLSGCNKTENAANQTTIEKTTKDSSNQCVSAKTVQPIEKTTSVFEERLWTPDKYQVFGSYAVNHFEQMFQTGKFNYFFRSYTGANILHYAALTGDLNRIKFLLSHEADINEKSSNGESILHFAVQSASLDVIQWLVEQGIDINAKDYGGKSVLHYALQKNSSFDVIRWLVEHGADVNSADMSGESVLLCAPWRRVEIFQWLVERGADIDAKDKKVMVIWN